MDPKPFTLDSVLKLRKRHEDMAQDQFVQAKLAVEHAQVALDTAKHKLQNLISVFEEKQKIGMLALELARFEERIVYSTSELQLLKNTLEKKKEVAHSKRKILLQKAKEHKILTSLKEQQNKAWKEHLNKKEAAMLDEIAIIHHDRKSS